MLATGKNVPELINNNAATTTSTTTETISSTTTATSTSGVGGILPFKSGVSGVVSLGPTCPVETTPADPNCADKPYETAVYIFRKSDPVHAIAITKTDKEGKFKISLPPGEYTLGAGESNIPSCNHPEVIVSSIGYSEAIIECDSGIR